MYQSSSLDFIILGCWSTKLSEINEEKVLCCLRGCRCRTWCVLSSRRCKSLILTVQFVLQMAAKGINCVQRVFFPRFSSPLHSLLISITVMDAAACDISLHFTVFLWCQSISFHIHARKLNDGRLRSHDSQQFKSKIKTFDYFLQLSYSNSTASFFSASPIKPNKLKWQRSTTSH